MRIGIGTAQLVFAVATLLVAASCAESGLNEIDLDAERQAILEVNARWMEAFQSHDAAGEAAVFARDGVEYREHQEPIVGPAALEAFDTQIFADNPTLEVSWTTDEILIAASGDLAIQTGEFRATRTGPEGDYENYGPILTVWKKEDGAWKVAHAMVETSKPLPEAGLEN